jgi:hypothetical protein
MTVGDQDHGGIPVTMSVAFGGRAKCEQCGMRHAVQPVRRPKV